MRILMLTEIMYPTDHVFLEEVYSKIFREKGHTIHWVMTSKYKENKILWWNKNKIYTIGSKKNMILNYLNLVGNLIKLNKKLNKSNYDLIYVRNEPIMGLYAIKFAKQQHIPFIFQLSHLKSEETIYFTKKNLYGSKMKNYVLGRISKKITDYILRKADLIFSISESMKEFLIKKKLSANKIAVLPLGANVDMVGNKKNQIKIAKDYNLKSGKTLIYLGTLIKTRDPLFLFNVIKTVVKNIPDLKLLVVGEGKDKNDLKEYRQFIKKNNLDNNIFLVGKVPRYKVLDYLAVSDIGLSQFPPIHFLKFNSPIKLMEYMAAGLAVIGNDYNNEQREIINRSKCGKLVKYNVPEFSNAIKFLVKNQNKTKEMGKKGKDYIKRNRTLRIIAKFAEEKMINVVGLKNEKRIIKIN